MTSLNTESEKERIRTVAHLLQQAAKPVRILKTIGWDPQIKADFFTNNAQQLPQVTYPKFDPNPTIEILREAKRNIFPQSSRVDIWLERQSNCIEWGALMLANVGNPAFLVYGRQAYGDPTTPLRYDPKTPLQLAQSIRDSIEKLDHIKMNIPSPPIHSSEEVAEVITKAVQEHFGEDAPEIAIVDQLSANALATSKQIRIRRMELNRFQRLADRVFAIQMAIEGADFIQVYRYFLERTDQPEQAFESTRRVFRGGVVSGGVPFTKDVVYLFGLLQVSAAIRGAFSAGRADCLRLLFCGKLDTFDIPALGELTALGLCKLPTYLPPWILDPRYLLALLTYSNFISQLDLETATNVIQRFLADTPVIEV